MILLCCSSILLSCSDDASEYADIPDIIGDLEERLMAGGEGTYITFGTTQSFSQPNRKLNSYEEKKHNLGDMVFEASFIKAGNSVRSGLGPIYNNVGCVKCHPNDGRAPFPENLIGLSGLFLRVSVGNDVYSGPVLVPGFGKQIQNQAVQGFSPEARFAVEFETVEEIFPDGTIVELRKPILRLEDTYISLPSGVMVSPRIGSPMIGLGLLEAISESDILANVGKYQEDGISGKPNYVWDAVNHKMSLGRFGWKANTATVYEQTAAAFVNDMGITNDLFQTEPALGQSHGNDGLKDDPELSKADLEHTVFYARTLAVPAPRGLGKEIVQRGAKVFEEIDCAKCHIPKFKTGPSDVAALAYQVIYPYTDLLLHDMGEGLADHRPDYAADGTEWKTPPLWGLGYTEVVGQHTNFLHDGRARNIEEAILWHGGASEKSKEK